MKTILTVKEQKAWVADNNTTLIHNWSSRGMGNSRILHGPNSRIRLSHAGGCGYDRYGKALGDAVSALFPKEVDKLAKRECKERSAFRNGSRQFYGLFYNRKDNEAYIDGACGDSCVTKILNKIGFSLVYVGECDKTSNSGEVFYTLVPVKDHDRRRLSY